MADCDRRSTWQEQLTELCADAGLAAKLYPGARANDLWNPEEHDLQLAWAMYTQLRTRIATQPLPIRDGIESTALKSLVDLFALSRDAMANRRMALHATSLLVHCLNHHIRPFTARWHAKSEAGELSSLDQRFCFRAELEKLQSVLRALTSVFGQMVGDRDARLLLEVPSAGFANEGTARGQLRYGIQVSGRHSEQVASMNAAERQLINARRGDASANLGAPVHDAVGLAISGGGIRAATFALGIVQVLARRGILQSVDVMSTVSGGGYLGCFMTSVLSASDATVGLRPGQQPFAADNHVESPLIRHLRNHSKYLSEGGLSTLAMMIFSAAYGIAMSLLLVAPVVLLLADFAVFGFGLGIESGSWIGVERWSAAPLLLSTAIWGTLGLAIFTLSVLRNPSKRWRESLERVAAVLLLLGLLIAIAQWIPDLYRFTQNSALALLGVAWALPLVLGVVGMWFGAKSMLGRLAWSLIMAFGPLFFVSTWLLSVELVVRMRDMNPLLPWCVTAAAFIYAWFGVNINFASLHLYYRNRLARTYLRRADATDAVDPQLLSSVNGSNKAPLHLINAAVNLPASRNPELRGRNTDFFTFAQHYCGGPSVGWWPTKDWEAKDPHLDLGTAMAISGAAAAPRMGTLTSAKYTALLAMLNVRLGYWARKPNSSPLPRAPGGRYFLRELTGQMQEDLSFLNVSDGGHIENLGIYELLRRRCRYIVAIDGEADPDHTFGGLLTAIQMAQIDLGVRIEPDLTDLRHGAEPFKRAHFVMIRIDYGEVDNSGRPIYGLLLVVKLALTGNESELLMRFRREYPSFPHQSTAQQLFSEAQFEAYRALGEHAAEASFDPLLAGESHGSVSIWLRELEQRLLPAAC